VPRKKPASKSTRSKPPPRAKARRAPPARLRTRRPADLRPGPAPVFGDIPWGYGQTRITAIARDPYTVFAYWEFPDEAVDAVRKKVSSRNGGIVLRVYDTTYRLFDGTNAHAWFDVPLDRDTNRYYLHLNRPATTFTFDIGLKSGDGRFATIARSGPAETPRDSISGDSRVDWKTVRSPESFRAYRHRFKPHKGGPPPAPPAAPAGPVPVPAPDLSRDPAPPPVPEVVREALVKEGWKEEHWSEPGRDGNNVRWVRWTGPLRPESAAPTGGKSFEKIEVEFRSDPWIVRQEKGERHVFGPWNVAVHGWEKKTGKQILNRWTVHSAWSTEELSVRAEIPVMVYRLVAGTRTRVLGGGSERRLARESWSSEAMLGGASERRGRAGSEMRLGGSSEMLYLAASEWMAQGASEGMAEAARSSRVGASERWADYKSGRPLFPPGGEKP
jgi:hypothetical protein